MTLGSKLERALSKRRDSRQRSGARNKRGKVITIPELEQRLVQKISSTGMSRAGCERISFFLKRFLAQRMDRRIYKSPDPCCDGSSESSPVCGQQKDSDDDDGDDFYLFLQKQNIALSHIPLWVFSTKE